MAELRARHSPWYTLSTEVDQEGELHKTYAELRARHSPWYILSTEVDQEGELHKTYG